MLQKCNETVRKHIKQYRPVFKNVPEITFYNMNALSCHWNQCLWNHLVISVPMCSELGSCSSAQICVHDLLIHKLGSWLQCYPNLACWVFAQGDSKGPSKTERDGYYPHPERYSKWGRSSWKDQFKGGILPRHEHHLLQCACSGWSLVWHQRVLIPSCRIHPQGPK